MSTKVQPIWSPSFQSLSSRMWILISFYTAIILAIPFWLKATSIERLPLPRHEVVAWEAQLPCPIRIHQSITLILPPDVIRVEDKFAVADRIQWALKAAGDGIWEQRRTRKHYVEEEQIVGDEGMIDDKTSEKVSIPLQYAACVDWDVRVVDLDEHRSVNGLHYEIEFLQNHETLPRLNSSDTARRIQVPLPAQLSSHDGIESEEVSFILSVYLGRLLQLPYTSLLTPFNSATSDSSESPLASPRSKKLLAEIEEREEDRRRVPYTRNLRLVFSLINEEISASSNGFTENRKEAAGVMGWNRQEVDHLFQERFSPLIKAFDSTQNVHTELQTTWFAPLQFQPKILEMETEPVVNEDFPQYTSEEETEREAIADLQETEEVEALKELEVQEEKSAPLIKKDRYHLIDWEDIKIFVNSGEWSLTSGAVTLPLTFVNTSSPSSEVFDEMTSLYEQSERTLHFITYIPKPLHRPLRVAGNQEATLLSDAKGWLIPQWGGVSIYNLGSEEMDPSIASSTGGHVVNYLSALELESTFAAFEQQFSTLIGLQELPISSITGEAKLAFQLDAMTRRRMMASSRESVRTLGSIIRLVDKIENLGVSKNVRDDVLMALDFLAKAKQFMNTTSTTDARTTLSDVAPLIPLQRVLELTHSSELISSRAFFNPNMIGQLYFPDEHKYAVYTPLFGPLAVPLLVAGLRLLKEKRKTDAQKRAEKAVKSR